MCFLKNIDRKLDYNTLFSKDQHPTHSISQFQDQLVSSIQEEKLVIPSPQLQPQHQNEIRLSMILNDLTFKILRNNQMLNSIYQKLMLSLPDVRNVTILQQSTQRNLFASKDSLLSKLFGEFYPEITKENFNYKLTLDKALPKKLFKSKKLQFGIKLTASGHKGDIIHHYNPLDICVGVFNSQGQWITQNLQGESILEGVTSVELFNGRAEFTKVFLREISANMPNKKFNLAIYVKPGIKSSMGVYQNQKNLKWEQIKPLLLKNLTILSKKRKNLFED